MNQIRLFFNSLAVVTIVVSLTLLVNFHTARIGLEPLPVNFETTSPNKAYTVRLIEQRVSHVLPAPAVFHEDSSLAEFSVYKNGQPLIERMELGNNSELFATSYPEHDWVASSTLWLGRKDLNRPNRDEVVIRNNSKRVIAYLRIRTFEDMFWLFDVQPDSTVKLSVPLQTGSHAFLDADGKFSDGKDILCEGVGFIIDGKYKGQGHYQVVVTDEGTRIDSPDFEVY